VKPGRFRSLDYYPSRELANHAGLDRRFANDADRVEFQRALSQHTSEASLIVEEFAECWDDITLKASKRFRITQRAGSGHTTTDARTWALEE